MCFKENLQMHKIEKVTLPSVKHIIAVASGKGGVGKSTVAANLALTLAQNGYRTALVDADLFGPSVPTMFGVDGSQVLQQQHGDKNYLIPIEKNGVKLMSIGFLVKPEQALIWRGPMASSALLQLFNETFWGEIDYMVVDLPPGTGDIPLTLCQQVDVDGVVVVTTPQQMSLVDVRKAISLFQNKDLSSEILGVVENMSWFTPSEHREEKYFLFGKGGGQILAKEYDLELLAQIPLVNGMAEAADKGSFYQYEQSKPVQDIYHSLVKKLTKKLTSNSTSTQNKQTMKKIAVPLTDNGLVDSHFGHCEYYGIFTISEKNEIANFKRVKSEDGCGCESNIAGWLKNQGVTIMLAGGIGQGAINKLNQSQIEVVRGCEGVAEKIVKQYISGLVADSGETCQGHANEDGHKCNH